MKHILITFIFLTILGFSAFPQGVLQFSLSEAQDYAIEHNKSVQTVRLDIKSSEQKIKEVRAQGLPQIDASLDWMTYFGYEIPFSFGPGETPSFTDEQITDAAFKTLAIFSGAPMAGLNAVSNQDLYNYQAGSYNNSLLSAMMPASTIKMNDASTAKFQIGQLIFSGQYWAGIKAAKLGQKIAEQGLDNSVLDIKESVTNSYYMALVTEKTIETLKKTIESLNEVKGHTENMYNSGMAEQTDVDQLSIQVTMLKNTLSSLDRGLQMVYSMMKFQLGIDISIDIKLSENLETIISIIDPTNQIGNFSIEDNLTYRLIETQEEITKKMVDLEKWSYAPTVTGFYAYNHKLLTTDFDLTPKSIAGFTLSLPVFSSGIRKHKVAQAKIELDKVILNKSMVEDQLMLQQKQLLLDLKTAIENFDAQKENVSMAQRVYDSFQNKFKQGMVSSLELTQSNSNYLQAESNYIQSIMALLQAKVAIDKLYNQL